jgi:molybdenum-dependent DNA-binding transcriptional regulator ModE
MALLSDEQRERALLEYAQTGSYRAAGRAVGCSADSVKRIVREAEQESRTPIAQLRAQKMAETVVNVLDEFKRAQLALLTALMDAGKIADADLKAVATSLGIVTDKILLMSGEATARTESVVADPSAKLTPDEMEAAARIRAKLAAGSVG